MASPYWRTDHTVGTLLEQHGIGWNFLQLIKLLLLVKRESISSNDTETLDILSRHIQFKSSLAADFPPGEVREVTEAAAKLQKIYRVVLSNNGLSTRDGPLPEPFIEWVKELNSRGNPVMADFLDLFNNRLSALRYLVCRATRPNVIDTPAINSDTGKLLQALTGVYYNRHPQQSDLRLAGLLANSRMSFPVIKQLLYFCLGLQLKTMKTYQGGWMDVSTHDHSILGNKAVCCLGKTTTLGTRVWDQQQAVAFVFGPLSWQKVIHMIPGAKLHQQLIDLLVRISDCRCDCKVTFLVPIDQVPQMQLGRYPHEVDSLQPLGLTTVLPIATQRLKDQQPLAISYTIKMSKYLRHYAQQGELHESV